MVNIFLVGPLFSWVRIVEIKLEKLVLRPEGGHDKQVVGIGWIRVTYLHVFTVCSELYLVHLRSLEHIYDRKRIVNTTKGDIGPVDAKCLLRRKFTLGVDGICLNILLYL